MFLEEKEVLDVGMMKMKIMDFILNLVLVQRKIGNVILDFIEMLILHASLLIQNMS